MCCKLELKDTDLIFLHLLKVPSPIVVTLLGIDILPLHRVLFGAMAYSTLSFINLSLSKVANLLYMYVRFSHPLNILYPKFSILSEIVAYFNRLHPANALLPMVVTLFGMIIFFSEVQLVNELNSIVFILLVKSIFSIDSHP